ncbi:peptidase [Arthrobacter echini]|uniref:Peptidase n=1 Tax=Arthrobacter echini TaxID=1529066 RepID=A0A4S5EAD9_9MICC|nr:DUF2268 domain-containing putative Zn-dependent protease [Arthrobacter echini]THJ68553.1 peptidase [Arthrobacter echini]
MTITILDTNAGMNAVLTAPMGERAGLLREMLTPVQGMFRYFPGDVDLVAMHAMSFGFPVDDRIDEVLDGLECLRSADVWTRIDTAMKDALGLQLAATPGITVPDVTVLLVLGDPRDEYFMGPVHGFSGNGSTTGFISLTLWPTEENLDRVEAAAVHELNHNLRYAPAGVTWNPAHVLVGEQIVAEGLADAFARQLYGDAGYTPIGLPQLHDDAVFDKVVTGLQVAGMQHFTAWVHGDAAVERFGGEPVGLPTGAGYAAGNRLVDAYLRTSGRTAAQALHVPSQDIIDVALTALE